MTMTLKNKTKVDNSARLQARKAELQQQLAVQRAELKEQWQTVRTKLEPAQLASSFVRSFLGLEKSGAENERAPFYQPLMLVADLFVREPRTRLLVKFAGPLLLEYWPKIKEKTKGLNPGKAEMYASLRRRVSGLRSQIRGVKLRGSESETQISEN